MNKRKQPRPVISASGIALNRSSSALSSSGRINKLNSNKPAKGQSDIGKFFGASPDKLTTANQFPDTPISKHGQTRQIQFQRTNSWLSNTDTGAFEDLSPDISFESPAPNNFRNPLLAKSSVASSSAGYATDFIDLTEDDTVVSSYSKPSSTASYYQPTAITSPTTISESSAFTTAKSSGRASRRLQDYLSSSNIKSNASMPNPRVKDESRMKVKTLKENEIVLSDEQNMVIKLAVDDSINLFYTGSAGTGKSVVLRELVKRLVSKYGESKVGVTASTGLAALNIGGQTINRFGNIGIGEGSAPELAAKIAKNRQSSDRWKNTKVLIVDEISMIDGRLFTKLNEIAKIIRGNQLPFGGIQVILTGDFFQLPPVPNRTGPLPQYCFQSDAWNRVIKKQILLTKVFRQQGDTELIEMLNALRFGKLDPRMVRSFQKLSRTVTYDDGIDPTELYPTREEVKRANAQRLNKLKGKIRFYDAVDSVPVHMRNQAKMLDNLMCEAKLVLKEDAQVMLLKNVDEDLVNGSIGRVLFVTTESVWMETLKHFSREDLADPEIIAEIRLLSTLYGVSDIAPDIARKIEEIPYDRKSRMMKILTAIKLESESRIVPVVLFTTLNGTKLHLVKREDFTIENKKRKEDSMNRSQIPLLLSWALSIHKSQGQTLDRVKVDLRKIFEKGQVYVALSRAVSKDRLEIANFSAAAIKVSEEVKSFYEKLEVLQ